MDGIQWLIGCSGFHYKEWKEIFYPKGIPQSKWFDYYAKHFNTLEINNTFYRFPQLKLFENWFQKSPDQFVFSVKVPGAITHYKQFNDTQSILNEFYQVAGEGLKEKLGCLLFQLPPKLTYSKETLESIISQMNLSYTNVIEFRNRSWWHAEVFKTLQKNNIVFCGVSYPGLTNDPVNNTMVSYYRFHGVPKLYYSSYEEKFLDKVIQETKDSNVKKAYLYFNNTASAAALENARYAQKII